MALPFQSRRSNVLSTGGCVAANEPQAARTGIEILSLGGNAADAAVAMAAVLGVTEPTGCGMGGDAFCLFYDAAEKRVKGLNGSGRCPAAQTLELVNSKGFDSDHLIPSDHGFGVTVPGAPAAWLDTLKNFGSGKVTLAEILNPAIQLAENGFPVSELISYWWGVGAGILKKSRFGKELLLDGEAPRAGQVMRRPTLANTLKTLLTEGKDGFYAGRVAEAIVEEVRIGGGVMSLEDLAAHTSTLVQPISTDYKGVCLWEIPPNGMGIVALEALNILEDFDLKGLGHNSVRYLHLLIEALKLSLADAFAFVADPSMSGVPTDGLISKAYAAERRQIISEDRALEVYLPGQPSGSDTTYFSVVDGDGNACSFITSNYQGLGTGIVPQNCGFSLQNRGLCFNLSPGHPNNPAPLKRPLHTIIPAMLTSADDGHLLASYGVMGGFMQPQGHVQVLLNMLEFGMSPQTAIDQARCLINPPTLYSGPNWGPILLEEGIPASHVQDLTAKGHKIQGPITGQARAFFGRGHVISRNDWWQSGDLKQGDKKHVLWAGSDPRCDGCAFIC